MSAPKGQNLTWHVGEVDKEARTAAHGHRGAVLWFTGLSGSGKSTIGHRVERMLIDRGAFAYVLDGDNIRHGLNKNLGFSPADRQENIRRLAEVTKLLRDAGIINLTAFISPYREDREFARSLSGDHDFLEIFVDCPVEVCEKRDPKGMYRKAREGIIKGYTGISAPYEEPEHPEIHVRTHQMSVEECTTKIMDTLVGLGLIK